MSGEQYTAIVSVIFKVEFTDDGDMSIDDQAHEAAVARFDPNEIYDAEVCEVHAMAPEVAA